jgi:uncharacterized protein
MYLPQKPKERIEVLDAIRGFALLGIFMVNMPLMYEPISKIMLGGTGDNLTLLEIFSKSFIKFFFEGKFFLIFSMLFGYGFYIFLQKPTESNSSVLSLYRRRLFILLLFGIAHIVLLWGGDVLFVYAIFGFLLLLFRKSGDKKIIRWAIFFVLIPILILAVLTLLFSLLNGIPEFKTELDVMNKENNLYYEELINRARSTYSTGSFGSIILMRLEEYADSFITSLIFFCPTIMGMFLIGFLSARKGLFTDLANKTALFKKILFRSLAIGLLANTAFVITMYHSDLFSLDHYFLLGTTMGLIGGIAFSLCYISIITLLFIKGKATFLSKTLVPMGKMALTNYLMQSTICAFLFHSYGLGFYGKVAVWQGILLTVLIYSLQVIFSRVWLSYFYFGPLEWLWRSLTYRKFQEMKLKK